MSGPGRTGWTAEPRRVRIGLASIAACSASVLLYAALRVFSALATSEPDPALVVWSEHAGFFWRAWTSVYLGTMAGFFAYVAAARHAVWLAGALTVAVPTSVLLLVLMAVLCP